MVIEHVLAKSLLYVSLVQFIIHVINIHVDGSGVEEDQV